MSKKKTNKIKFKSSYSNKKVNYSWLIGISIATFIMALILGYFSLVFMEKVSLFGASIILFFLVLMGVFFDGLGIAVTAANETPFHSMAANKVVGAKESILIIRSASMVSNFFNDVIGDISGIISGSAAAVIVIKINERISVVSILTSLLLTALIAGLTVGGKAIGKEIALRKSNAIVYRLGILLYYTNIMNIFGKK
ncbi:hypothetical protein EDC18_101221 [Natranaerovirga pectinivora]|uniref:Uncharacterized protein n=1 Tax=Natranaerovirga pectinivora TaxID=682400 RepID=A0A4R3MNS3_9FIRM|nr:hypothetical protein [Natranaerovirga pectinivora]TCT16925.1 hypothetical protein EDC18_101221 [Natranaerovirga pectinivora]